MLGACVHLVALRAPFPSKPGATPPAGTPTQPPLNGNRTSRRSTWETRVVDRAGGTLRERPARSRARAAPRVGGESPRRGDSAPYEPSTGSRRVAPEAELRGGGGLPGIARRRAVRWPSGGAGVDDAQLVDRAARRERSTRVSFGESQGMPRGPRVARCCVARRQRGDLGKKTGPVLVTVAACRPWQTQTRSTRRQR